MPYLHFDEAKNAIPAAIDDLSGIHASRVLIVIDFLGKIRVVLWKGLAADEKLTDSVLAKRCGSWWAGQILEFEPLDSATKQIYESAWESAQEAGTDRRFRVLDRHRSRADWFHVADPPWAAPVDGPPILVFYSFKGGLGRSTLLASYAVRRSQAGDRVCVLDFDLESPGIGMILSADTEGRTSRWGVVDFLLENPSGDVPLDDYYHRCDRVSGAGQILVFPAGILDDIYLDKLAKIDLGEKNGQDPSRLIGLLSRIRDELKPSCILIDARTGISELVGDLLSGIAHVHVLLGVGQEQSWQGLRRILDRIGKQRLDRDRPQGDVIVVQAMVPSGEAGRISVERFAAQAESVFDGLYYLAAELASDDEEAWTINDKGVADAPHVPIAIEYDSRLAGYDDISDIEGIISSGPYLAFFERLEDRFARETQE